MFLLFLTNFFDKAYNNYINFKDLVESVKIVIFNQTLSVKNYINKIMDFFIYILGEHVTYPLNFWDFNDSVEFHEDDNEKNEEKLSKKVRDNRMKLKIFLNEIINEVLKND